jgi:hypothetical protein
LDTTILYDDREAVFQSRFAGTGGTMLNERMQDFLMAVDEYSTACENKQTEQIKSGFADLLKKYIEINDDNAIGEYIRTAYRSSL